MKITDRFCYVYFVLLYGALSLSQDFMFLSEKEFGIHQNGTLQTVALDAVTSFAWGDGDCEAWVIRSGEIHRASVQTPTGIQADRILSDVILNHIYYSQGTGLFKLDLDGFTVTSVEIATAGLERIVEAGRTRFFLYQDSERGIYIRAYNTEKLAEFEYHINGEVSWNPVRMRTSEDQLAIGFTAKSAYSANSPHLTLLSFDLKLLSQTVWPHKGLLLDVCARENNQWMVSLDQPNSSFTVPVSVYLDALTSEGTPKRFFEGDLNRLMEHIDCSQDRFILGERSVLRGQSQISTLANNTKVKVWTPSSALLGVRFCEDKKNATSKEVAF